MILLQALSTDVPQLRMRFELLFFSCPTSHMHIFPIPQPHYIAIP